MAGNEAQRGCKPDLCESCAFANCGLRCMNEKGCELDMGRLCKCDLVLPGEDCKYFKETDCHGRGDGERIATAPAEPRNDKSVASDAYDAVMTNM